MSQESESSSLSSRIRSGDSLAISEFTTKYKSEILRTLRIQLRKYQTHSPSRNSIGSPTTSNVNSLLNESLLRLIKHIQTYELERPDALLLPTLFTISRNLLIDRYRRRAISPFSSTATSMDDEATAYDDPPGKQLENEETSDELRRHITDLTEPQQALLNLVINNTPYHEIAKILNRNPGSLRSDMSRIRKSIKEKMAD